MTGIPQEAEHTTTDICSTFLSLTRLAPFAFIWSSVSVSRQM